MTSPRVPDDALVTEDRSIILGLHNAVSGLE